MLSELSTLVSSFVDILTGQIVNLGFALAVIGAGLGLLNFFRDIRKTKRQESVRLMITPRISYHKFGVGIVSSAENIFIDKEDVFAEKENISLELNGFLSIFIANQSHFTVYIIDILLNASPKMGMQKSLGRTEVNPKQDLPYRLDRNQGMWIHAFGSEVDGLTRLGIHSVTIELATGERLTGTSPVMAQISRAYKSLPRSKNGIVDINKVTTQEVAAAIERAQVSKAFRG